MRGKQPDLSQTRSSSAEDNITTCTAANPTAAAASGDGDPTPRLSTRKSSLQQEDFSSIRVSKRRSFTESEDATVTTRTSSLIPPRKSQRHSTGGISTSTTTTTTKKAKNNQKKIKRRSSGNLATDDSNKKPAARPLIYDSYPDRLTNPLIEDSNVTAVADLLKITDGIEFHQPDTYNLNYMAKLLGLQQELLELATADGKVPAKDLLAHLEQSPNERPLEDPTEAAIFKVPAKGIIPEHLRFWNADDDADQLQKNLNRLDPLYVQLRQNPPSSQSCIHSPVTASEHAKLLHLTATAATTASTSAASTTGEGDPPSMNKQQKEVLESVVVQAADNSTYLGTYTFLPLELAREIYSTSEMESLLPASESEPGVLSGWVATTAAVTQQENSVNHSFEMEGNSAGASNQKDSFVDSDSPRVPEYGRPVGAVVFQLEWYRGVHQPIEASELILQVVGTTTATTEEALATTTKAALTNTKVAATPEFASDEVSAAGEDGEKPTADDKFVQVAKEECLDEDARSWLRLMLTALVIEQARACQVWYALFVAQTASERSFLEHYFRMTAVDDGGRSKSTLICDIHKCSSRYAFLQYQEDKLKSSIQTSASAMSLTVAQDDDCTPKQRWLVRLPTLEESEAALRVPVNYGVSEMGGETVVGTGRAGEGAVIPRQKRGFLRKASQGANITHFTGATDAARTVTLGLRAVIAKTQQNPDCYSAIKLLRLNADGTEGPEIALPTFYEELPSLEIMRNFRVAQPLQKEDLQQKNQRQGEDNEDLIVQNLISKQNELATLEKELNPSLRLLLAKVVNERVEYESSAATLKQEEERRVLAENRKMLERRKELDLAWQKQLEQDMDAVCEICADGEVTPDNQILFCEACNVAVHQICYGIEMVPEGDYYCLACRRLGRDKRHLDAPQLASVPKPLPICCELCPLRQGAYIRTNMPQTGGDTRDKWIHVVCAKWQGLSFVDNKKPDLIEDVTELKMGFRRHGIKCELCLGERGAMNKCTGASDCNKWFHVTCARAVGTLSVTHGEDCRGPVEVNGWCLSCPEHSNIPPEAVPKKAIPVEKLILTAKEFPPEPRPPPEPKPFNTLTGSERKELLADFTYESALISELLMKRFYGVRCEVCNHVEEESKNLTRCVGCNIVFCRACKLPSDEMRGSYKCPSCLFIEGKNKAGEETEAPKCCACYQKGGFLRKAFASPVNKKSYWKTRPKEFEKSMFGRDLWIHSVCAFWVPQVNLAPETGIVDLSNVVLSNGNGLIKNKVRCFLCGQKGGLKLRCDREGCCMACDGTQHTAMHVTCARQAGLEVALDDSEEIYFYLNCYRHGGNEFNLRAKLEDLIEIEKRRAGKDHSRADYPINFADGSRLLNSAIQVMRILGWAWRWAEWWVDYDSSWEPLLEPGQKERNMTKEQLKIVDSTRESRCADARRCRLAAFGAALRNRCYDTSEGFNRAALDRALRAVLHTESLVGPLKDFEVDFYVEWLGRAYRSKSRLLAFGDDKIIVSEKAEFCVHIKDKSPKCELGNRPIPGFQEIPEGTIFEIDVEEVDDFMLTTPLGPPISYRRGKASKKRKNPPSSTNFDAKAASRADTEPEDASIIDKTAAVATLAPSAVKTRRGRPAKDRSRTQGYADTDLAETSPTRKRRGRPPKKLRLEDDGGLSAVESTPSTTTIVAPYTGKRRGRPPKKRPAQQEDDPNASIPNTPGTAKSGEDTTAPSTGKRRRGRPPKKPRLQDADTHGFTSATLGTTLLEETEIASVIASPGEGSATFSTGQRRRGRPPRNLSLQDADTPSGLTSSTLPVSASIDKADVASSIDETTVQPAKNRHGQASVSDGSEMKSDFTTRGDAAKGVSNEEEGSTSGMQQSLSRQNQQMHGKCYTTSIEQNNHGLEFSLPVTEINLEPSQEVRTSTEIGSQQERSREKNLGDNLEASLSAAMQKGESKVFSEEKGRVVTQHDSSTDQNQIITENAEMVAQAHSAAMETAGAGASKFDVVKRRHRKITKPLNVGLDQSAGKSYENDNRRTRSGTRTRVSHYEDNLSIDQLVSKRRASLPSAGVEAATLETLQDEKRPAEDDTKSLIAEENPGVTGIAEPFATRSSVVVGQSQTEGGQHQTSVAASQPPAADLKDETIANSTPQQRGRRLGKKKAANQIDL